MSIYNTQHSTYTVTYYIIEVFYALLKLKILILYYLSQNPNII